MVRSLIVPLLLLHNLINYTTKPTTKSSGFCCFYVLKLNYMATTVYNNKTIKLIDGTIIEAMPLKIKYLREFMDAFQVVHTANNDDQAINLLSECVRIAMKQYYPSISKTVEDVEDNIDLPGIYEVLDVAGGIRINDKSEETVKSQATESGITWDTLDLAKLESEVFLLGIWKDYNELELSLSMPELLATLASKRELDYEEKKFLAAIQGVDLDAQNGKSRGQKEWEDMKARVFSKGATEDSNDVLALQGINAQKAGFGIGFGLDYEDARDPSAML
jgi:hypothetical protein